MKIENKMLKAPASWLHSTTAPSVILFFVSLLFAVFVTNANFDLNYLFSFLSSNIAILCICIGEAVVIITGGIDISLGAVISLCNVLLVMLMDRGVPLPVAILVMFAVALLAGMLNGVMIGVMRISPLLTTYATSIIFGGIALVITRTPIYLKTSTLSDFYKYRLFGFFPMSLSLVVVLYVIWKVYQRTRGGVHLYAIGENEQSAYCSGIQVVKTKIIAYAFAGLTAGMGALAVTGMIQGGDPKIGISMPMTAISAVVIGGVALSGGKGDVGGGIFGCLFLYMLSNIIVFWGVNTFWQGLLRTLILLLSIVVSVIVSDEKTKEKIQKGLRYVQKSSKH